MKRFTGFLLLALAVAATAYGLTRYLAARKTEDQWTWLRREFRLNDAQFSRIQALHQAYQPVCAEHCRRIMELQKHMEELEQTGSKSSPDYTAAQAEWQAVTRECNQTTLRHLQQVSAEMNPDDGRRYLDLMVPHIAQYNHREPRGVR